MTKNFKLKEFIESKFYNKSNQKLVWDSFYKNEKELVENIKQLAESLQVLREYLNKPILINIAYRPVWWELKKGRSGNSLHTKGLAADINVQGITTQDLKEVIEHLIKENKMKQGGLGYYPAFIHYDIRGKKARW